VTDLPEFKRNEQPTVGVELELMLIDPASFDLTTTAVSVRELATQRGLDERVKLEITQSMIEVNSSVHLEHAGLREELGGVARALSSAARERATLICGGGTHPFHRWQERELSPTERFREVGFQFGYLAKQFTVFGQHVHIGCPGGDEAVHTVHRLALFVPHFIALSAASPFHRGIDTAFDSCRLNMVAAFPLSGRMPAVRSWSEFVAFFTRLKQLGVVSSIKDFYWDIRPKPELGTVELRVPDTPLGVLDAADIAAYTQVLVEWTRRVAPTEWLDDYVYRHNRFQAARFGYYGRMIVGSFGERLTVQDHIRFTLDRVAAVSAELGCTEAIARLATKAETTSNDAGWLRRQRASARSLAEVVERSCARWRESVGSGAEEAA
jgi:carboxylate-amine ligase